MPLSDIITVSISIKDAVLNQAGFGTPLIMGTSQAFPERVREYNTATASNDMQTDGFGANSAEVRAAEAIAAQTTSPTKIKVGRRAPANVPTRTLNFTAQNVAEGEVYTITVSGTDFSHTASASDTATDVATNLVTAINAGSEPVTATDNTGDLDLVEDNKGDALEITYSGDFAVVDNTADASSATELSAIETADPDWYGLLTVYPVPNEITALASPMESKKKIFVTSAIDTAIAGAGSSDLFSTLQTSSYNRTIPLYHENPTEYPDAAWVGRMFGLDPGQGTWKFKTLAGIAKSNLSSTETSNLDGKSGNWYVNIAGVGMTFQGWASSGRYADITRFVDWLEARIKERVATLLANTEKVPYTNAGIAQIQSEVRAVLRSGVAIGGLAEDPAPKVTVPDKADISSAKVSSRTLPLVNFSATLAGAIHKVEISGSIST